MKINGSTYLCQKRKCNKPGCNGCPHGPYWYRYWTENGKRKSEYLGQFKPDAVQQAEAQPAAPQPLKPMSKRQALAVLGIGLDWSYLKAQNRWQFLRKTYGKRGEEGRADVVEVDEAWALICEDLH